MSTHTIVVFLTIVFNSYINGVREQQISQQIEQTHFSAEESAVEKPVSVPDEVLIILEKDDMVRAALVNENIPAERTPRSWFSASEVHLNGPSELDLIVMAEGSLRGSNVTTFWVFRPGSRNYDLVLNAAAHDLTVKKIRWKGYREIELTSMTAVNISTVLCRFNGKTYTEYKTRSKPIGSRF